MSLSDDVIKIKGVGSKTRTLLNKLGIFTKNDLLRYFPRNYDKYGDILPINNLEEGISAVIQAKPSYPKLKKMGNKSILICEVADDTGKIDINWFNQPFIKTKLRIGVPTIFRGRIIKKSGLRVIQPEILTMEEYLRKKSTLQPIYALTHGITSNSIRKFIKNVLTEITADIDFLPVEIRQNYSLETLFNAINEIHFPQSYETLLSARRRLVFDEFFLFILNIDSLKKKSVRKSNYRIMHDSLIDEFIKNLPFNLTNAQRRVWSEIENDLLNGIRLNRLVQGDVGSGKTVIAMLSCVLMAKNGYQSSLMVPTEVLARQHYTIFKETLKNYGINTVLLTGSVRGRERKEVLEKIKNHNADIIIGTHALIQEKVIYDNLALVITDEQHRFGVKQREKLSQKGDEPHTIVMSATPIPRTLAVILYGDLDISIVDELPKERLPIKNCVVGEEYRKTAYNFIFTEVKNGHQAYIICPLIEEREDSESDERSAVIEYSKDLSKIFKEKINIKYLHGKMKNDEKNAIMREFAEGNIDILVSTTVVEVGINVPNATVMMIENAENFGLSTLHQLRGRIGRGKAQSYCIFMSGTSSKISRERLNILTSSNNGFEIAEKDMKLRGPGDVFGIRQSGELDFRISDIIGDADVLKLASEIIKSISDKSKNECYHKGKLFYGMNFYEGEKAVTL